MSNQRRAKLLVVICLALGFVGAHVPSASADVLDVPGDYATISAAVAIAQVSDTVLVQEGVHEEGFTIPEGVTVLAAGGSIPLSVEILRLPPMVHAAFA